MTTEERENHDRNVEWLMKNKPHRVAAFLKAMTPEEFEKVWACRSEQDDQAGNDHLHDYFAKHGTN